MTDLTNLDPEELEKMLDAVETMDDLHFTCDFTTKTLTVIQSGSSGILRSIHKMETKKRFRKKMFDKIFKRIHITLNLGPKYKFIGDTVNIREYVFQNSAFRSDLIFTICAVFNYGVLLVVRSSTISLVTSYDTGIDAKGPHFVHRVTYQFKNGPLILNKGVDIINTIEGYTKTLIPYICKSHSMDVKTNPDEVSTILVKIYPLKGVFYDLVESIEAAKKGGLSDTQRSKINFTLEIIKRLSRLFKITTYGRFSQLMPQAIYHGFPEKKRITQIMVKDQFIEITKIPPPAKTESDSMNEVENIIPTHIISLTEPISDPEPTLIVPTKEKSEPILTLDEMEELD